MLVRKWFSAVGAVPDGDLLLSGVNLGKASACSLDGSDHRGLINEHLLAVSLRVLEHFKATSPGPARQGALRHAVLLSCCVNRYCVRVGLWYHVINLSRLSKICQMEGV